MQRLIFFMFLATKLIIARSWKKSVYIYMSLYGRKVSWIMLNEQLTSVINDTIWGYLEPFGLSMFILKLEHQFRPFWLDKLED